jgi:hypothetical protein
MQRHQPGLLVLADHGEHRGVQIHVGRSSASVSPTRSPSRGDQADHGVAGGRRHRRRDRLGRVDERSDLFRRIDMRRRPVRRHRQQVDGWDLAARVERMQMTGKDTHHPKPALAVAKAAKNLGYIAKYQHAFSLYGLIYALKIGPVIVGVPWFENFFRPATAPVPRLPTRSPGPAPRTR